jgi:succinate dehydrogenase/fumarate reductase iron-sulfur protein
MAGPNEISVRIFRFDPAADATPRYETHSVPRTPGMRVLDALNHLYDTAGEPIAHRWYCGTKKCGECAVTVNGKPVLACWEAAEDGMTCEPLANVPIIRDVAVDTAGMEARIVALNPELVRKNPPPFPERLDPKAMEPSNRLAKCIECHVCSAVVPAKGLGAEGLELPGRAGAAGLVRFARFVVDPRDEGDRRATAERAGMGEIPAEPVLSSICPQGIDILGEAMEPVRTKLLGAKGSAPAEPSSVAFVKSRAWSAFVRLTDAAKSALTANGTLKKMDVPDLPEAYRAD